MLLLLAKPSKQTLNPYFNIRVCVCIRIYTHTIYTVSVTLAELGNLFYMYNFIFFLIYTLLILFI